MVREGEVVAGKYRIDRVLGKGAMGEVVAAWHLKLQKPVAVKFMLPEALGNREGVERFMREARAAAQLKSQHAVKIFDVDALPSGAPYIVMEHLDGIDLRTFQQSRGALPVVEAATYLFQTCEAIAEAHQIGIIHRDLKPANLYLARGVGGRPCVKVLDFGIAKVMDGSSPATASQHLTNTYAIMGTPLFMSPEQILSTRDVDPRSDIWSLGVILYSFVTAQLPFSGENTHELFVNIREQEVRSPSASMPSIPPAFSEVILRCLEKDPARRFQSADELALALLPFTMSGPTLSIPSARLAPTVNDARMSMPGQHPPLETQTLSGAPAPHLRISVAEPLAMQTGAPTTRTHAGPAVTSHRARGAVVIGGTLALALGVGLGVSLWRPPAESSADPASSSSTAAVVPSVTGAEPSLMGTVAASSVIPTDAPVAKAEPSAPTASSLVDKGGDAPSNPGGKPTTAVKPPREPKLAATTATAGPGPTAPPPVQTAAASASSTVRSKKLWGTRNP